ncbi:MAG TPA: hypothetical protein VFC02_26910, partial [Anaerolineales bacterium]|nr:hypothetical protein [Anaerolineales bacterium]
PISLWVVLWMSLFLVLSTEAADVKTRVVVNDPDFGIPEVVSLGTQPLGPVNPSLTFVQTDPGTIIAGSERRVQGNTQTINNTQTPGELFGITLLRQSRVSQLSSFVHSVTLQRGCDTRVVS